MGGHGTQGDYLAEFFWIGFFQTIIQPGLPPEKKNPAQHTIRK